jgi:hypothetical protein
MTCLVFIMVRGVESVLPPGLSVARVGGGRLQIAPGALLALRCAMVKPILDLAEGLVDRGVDRVIAALGEHIRAGRDEMNAHAKGGTGLEAAFQPDVGLVNPQPGLQREDAIFDQRIQRVGGAQVVMLQVQFHVLFAFR